MSFTFGDQPLTFDQAKTILTASKTQIDLMDHCSTLDQMTLVKLSADTGNIKFAELALTAQYAKKSPGKKVKGTKPKPCNIVNISRKNDF